jgi:hypothetical protein
MDALLALRSCATPRPRPKFNGPVDARSLVGEQGGPVTVKTRTGPAIPGEVAISLEVSFGLKAAVAEDRFEGVWRRPASPAHGSTAASVRLARRLARLVGG